MTKFLSTAKLRVFRMSCTHDVHVRTVGVLILPFPSYKDSLSFELNPANPAILLWGSKFV